jgi:subtilisin family serine protease
MFRSLRSKSAAVMAILMSAVLVTAFSNSDSLQLDVNKLTPQLVEQVGNAQPGELFEVVIEVARRPELGAVSGDRAAVLAVLKKHVSACEDIVRRLISRELVSGEAQILYTTPLTGRVAVLATPRTIGKLTRSRNIRHVFQDVAQAALDRKPEPGPLLGPGDPECDPDQEQLWDNIGKIGAKKVWEIYGIEGNGVRTGAIDAGIDSSHADFTGKIYAMTVLDSSGNPLPPEYCGDHGMLDVGIIIGGNESGYSIGVAPGVTHVHTSISKRSNTSYECALYWLLDPDSIPGTDDGADVISISYNMNMSQVVEEPAIINYPWWFGGLHSWVETFLPQINWLCDIVDYVRAANTMICIAIGNCNSGVPYWNWGGMHCWPKTFSVGNVDSLDQLWTGDDLATGSCLGPALWPDTLAQIDSDRYGFLAEHERWVKPDAVAPGTRIYTSLCEDWGWQLQGVSICGHITGTSPATPHVTGTVALMLEANPSLGVDDAFDILHNTALELGGAGLEGPDSLYGYGRIDAFAAVTAALDVDLTSNTPTPGDPLDFCDGKLDTFVVTIDLPEFLSVDEIPESLITLVPADPPSSSIQFISEGPIYADSAATQANGYTTTITHSDITGSGADVVSVAIDGALLSGTAPIYVQGCGSGSGKVKPHDPGEAPERVPGITSLGNALPSPFNRETTIPYQVGTQGTHVRIAVYDAAGRLVRTLVDRWQAPGMYRAAWDGRDGSGKTLSSGVYFYRMTAGSFVDSKKLVLLK